MSRRYILDGYNVLHSTRRWNDLTREAERVQFLRYLENNRPAGSERNTVTVVLDGYAASLRGIRLSYARLVFSGDEDADTVIKKMVEELPNPKDAIVVTNDRALRSAVRHAGAQVMACEDFFRLKEKKAFLRKSDEPDPTSTESINRELKRLWKLE